jgi:hypothetical protein
MRTISVRTIGVWCGGFLAALVLWGCGSAASISLMYNHADWLMTRQLDNYVDLSSSQKAFVTERLDRILNRHRQEALPRYEAVLGEARARIQRGLTDKDIDWAFAQYETLREDLLSRFVSDGTEFAGLVEETQLIRVRSSLDARLAKQERVLKESFERRQAQRTDAVVTLAREWLGSLDRPQRRQIAEAAMAFPDTWPVFYAHQCRRNEELISLLASRMNDDFPTRFHHWLMRIEDSDDPQFAASTRQLKHQLKGLILALDRIATQTQRKHVLAKLDDLSLTVHRLSRT